MLIMWGTQHYGKVDHVPGVFYVATSFFYLNFVPLVPTGSYLILDGTDHGVSIGLNGKSVLFGYLRAACVIGGIVAVVLAIIALGNVTKGRAAWHALAGPALTALGLFVLLLASYRLARPSARRALQLALKAGLDPQAIVDYYGKVNTTASLGKDASPTHEAYRSDSP